MAKIVVTMSFVALVAMLAGCHNIDSGKSQMMTTNAKITSTFQTTQDGEADIIEQLVASRQMYRRNIETLIAHYNKTGNVMQAKWARKELKGFDGVPQYNYIIEAIIAGDLKADTSILVADYMYQEARSLEKKGRGFAFFVDNNKLRQALGQYNNLIRTHPSSDKIDDAAYRAAGILEHFKDYTIAIMYYKRAYQWNPDITLPARYKAAYIMDVRLACRAEALELYQEAIDAGNLNEIQKEFAGQRIAEITQSDRDK